MNITKLLYGQNPAGTGLNAGITVDVATPQNKAGRKLYRQLTFLAFKIEPNCQGIRIDSNNSQFQGYFQDYTLHLTATNTSFQTQNWEGVKENGSSSVNLVKVHLTQPWRLQSLSTNDSRGVEVLRLDGDAVSKEATISGNANYGFVDEFIGQDFALRKVATFPIVIMVEILEPVAGNVHVKTKAKAKQAQKIATSDAMPADHIAQQAGQSISAVATYGIQSINLKSVPTGPRILLGDIGATPDVNAALLSLWQQPGEQLQGSVNFCVDSNERTALLQQIQATLDRFFSARQADIDAGDVVPALPAYVYLPLVFESDTPAQLRLTQFNIHYSLLRTRFDNELDKLTLTFDGTAVTQQNRALNLPANSVIKKAQLVAQSHLKQGFAVSDITDSSNLNQYTGIDINTGSSVTQRFALPAPQQFDHAFLALLSLTDTVQSSVELLADFQNSPSGTPLARATMTLTPSGIRSWVVADFAGTTLLDAGTYWMRVLVQQGRLLWLGQNGNGHVRIKVTPQSEKIVTTLQLLQVLDTNSVSAGAGNPVAIKVESQLAQAIGDANSGWTVDFAAGLNSFYSAGKAAPASLCFISGCSGNITIKNIDVEYEISQTGL